MGSHQVVHRLSAGERLGSTYVIPMPLINYLLEDLEGALWYCSLDMVSCFRIVGMNEREKQISAFFTTLGIFEWSQMPFGLKNAPQMYYRLFEYAMYGFLRIPPRAKKDDPEDLFKVGESDAQSDP